MMNYKYYPVGEAAIDYKPGDFFLVETKGAAAKVIRFGQWLRYHGKMKPFSHWNHTGVIINSNGDTIEAKPTNVSQGNIQDYIDCTLYIVSTNLNNQSAQQVEASAKSFLNDKYGWLTIGSIVLQLLTGVKVQLSFSKSVICSGLVAQSLWAGGIIFSDNPFQMMPADLAAAFNVVRKQNE